MIRVVVVDDHHLVRRGICALLSAVEDIDVVGEAKDGEEAIQRVAETSPGVVLMDIALPGMDGILTMTQILASNPGANVIILSVHDNEAVVLRALRAGAKGYLLKTALVEDLVRAIRAAAKGKVFLSTDIGAVMVSAIRAAPEDTDGTPGRLSHREREVLTLVASGYNNKEIAGRLSLSVKTVEAHRTHLAAKLGVRNPASLTRLAIRLGLVTLEE